MFIPNKTFNVMKVGVLGLIATLILVIAGGTVLFVKMEHKNNVVLDSLTNATTTEFDNTNDNYKNAETEIKELKLLLEEQLQVVTTLQETLNRTQSSVDKLIRNECTYYSLTKDMVTMCRSLEVVP